jgi:hypothetical protein
MLQKVCVGYKSTTEGPGRGQERTIVDQSEIIIADQGAYWSIYYSYNRTPLNDGK